MNGVKERKRKKIHRHALMFSRKSKMWPFHVLLERTAKNVPKCKTHGQGHCCCSFEKLLLLFESPPRTHQDQETRHFSWQNAFQYGNQTS